MTPARWLLDHATRTPSAPFLGTPDGWLTYGETWSRVERVRGFFSSLGVTAGTRVLLALPSVPGTVIAWAAVQSLGATTVEVDREWSDAALREVITQSKPVLALISGRDARKWTSLDVARCAVVHPSAPPAAMQGVLGAKYAGWVSEDGVVDAAPSTLELASADVAQIVFTSGSTSTPRGVLQTSKMLEASTNGIVEYLHLTSADRAMLVLPLFYVYGKSVLLSHLRVGGSVFLDHRFMYPRVVMEALAAERCTNFSGVPLTFESLKRQSALTGLDLSSLRFVTQAGGAMQGTTIDWARETFAPAHLFVMYGQTEATSRLSFLPPDLATKKRGSIGRGMPGVTLAVVDDAGAPVAAGVEGHLVAKGDVVMPGYLDAPDETAKVLKDGWLWTGDLATRDADGFVFITGRSKVALKLGGHRVAPAELERAIVERAGVREAVVVGAPDPLEGEVAIAFVVVDDASLDVSMVLKHCRAVLPPARVPRRVVFVPDFPRNSTGKVLLGELQKRAAALHAIPAEGGVT
jgi:acyl-coenzyme A synthetase/AMP-(fatty) acid ligase